MISILSVTDQITHAVLASLDKHRDYLDSTGSALRSVEIIVKMDMKRGGAGLVLMNPSFENVVNGRPEF